MSKRNKIYFGIIVVALLCCCINMHFDSLGKEARGRVHLTFTTLKRLRIEISEYQEKNHDYPENLIVLREYINSSGNESIANNTFYVNFRKTSDFEKHEVNALDGTGGLYYNNETGEIRVNLNKPVNYYEKHSPTRRDEIPSEW